MAMMTSPAFFTLTLDLMGHLASCYLNHFDRTAFRLVCSKTRKVVCKLSQQLYWYVFMPLASVYIWDNAEELDDICNIIRYAQGNFRFWGDTFIMRVYSVRVELYDNDLKCAIYSNDDQWDGSCIQTMSWTGQLHSRFWFCLKNNFNGKTKTLGYHLKFMYHPRCQSEIKNIY